MKNLLALLAAVLLSVSVVHPDVHAQGCVAIRHFSCGGTSLENAMLRPGDIMAGTSYRYFRSFRHFKGTHEEPDRVANQTEVINYAHAVDLNLLFAVSRRAYASLTLPFVANVRSSLYEHGREERHNSFSRGLADARVGMGYWLMMPSASSNRALAVGLGIKLPTGNHSATDLFYNVGVDGRPEVRPVDQSIQPGDGGVGLTLDFQAYQYVGAGLSVYGNGFYLLNPMQMNGVRTFRETLSPILQNEAIMSVPDQYSLRAGASFEPSSGSLGASLGVRYEGIPVEDLLGDSMGFRRPGSVLSIEPGVSYTVGGVSIGASVPVAIRRNRPQSVTDRETEALIGTPRNGDAAFADYLFNVGFTYRLNSRSERDTVPATF